MKIDHQDKWLGWSVLKKLSLKKIAKNPLFRPTNALFRSRKAFVSFHLCSNQFISKQVQKQIYLWKIKFRGIFGFWQI